MLKSLKFTSELPTRIDGAEWWLAYENKYLLTDARCDQGL